MKKSIDIWRMKEGKEALPDEVIVETPLTIYVNNNELSTLLCSPADLEYLAVGFLYSEGIVKNREDIREVKIDIKEGKAMVETKNPLDVESFQKRIITSGCVGYYSAANLGLTWFENKMKLKKSEVIRMINELESKSLLFKATGGVHSSALFENGKMLQFSEDIGRHNTIDKIIGYMLLNRITSGDKMLATSGRLSSEMVMKAARMRIPIVASRSAPTDLAVSLAKKLNVTLIGFVRNDRINIYTNEGNVLPG